MKEESYPIWHPNTQKRFYSQPLKVKRAKDSYLILENGKKVLDMTCSWWVTLHGHAHPKISQAIYEQSLKLEQVLFANFTHDPAIKLAQKLLELLPKKLSKVFFSDNGSTSVEVALKMAYQYWINIGENQRSRFLCFENAYHGDTVGAMSASSRSVFNRLFEPLLFEVDRVPFPYTFENDSNIEEKENTSLEAIQSNIQKYKNQYAAILIEPLIQGAAGMRICRPKFLSSLEEIAKKEKILLIYDEVFVGFGRTGDFFACTKTQTSPDILCLSKGITGGFLPLSVSICSLEIYKAFYQEDPMKTFFHGHSYTANPLGCAAGIASLNLLKENPDSFQRLEKLHRKHSKKLRKCPNVKQLRFCGTVSAFDLETKEKPGYMNSISKHIYKECLRRGVYIRPLGNTIYVMPPYCSTEEELENVYDVLSIVISELPHE